MGLRYHIYLELLCLGNATNGHKGRFGMRVLLQGEHAGALEVYKRVLESIDPDIEVAVQDEHSCINAFDVVFDFGRNKPNPYVLKSDLRQTRAADRHP